MLLDMLVIGRDGFAILFPPLATLRFTRFLDQCLVERVQLYEFVCWPTGLPRFALEIEISCAGN